MLKKASKARLGVKSGNGQNPVRVSISRKSVKFALRSKNTIRPQLSSCNICTLCNFLMVFVVGSVSTFPLYVNEANPALSASDYGRPSPPKGCQMLKRVSNNQ